jgi:hypothetical protein
VDKLLQILEWIIPPETQARMTAAHERLESRAQFGKIVLKV